MTPTPLKKQRNFFLTGATLNAEFRKDSLLKLKKIIKEFEPELYKALAQDLGKPKLESYISEIGNTYEEINYLVEHLEEWMEPESVKSSLTVFPATAEIQSQPFGQTLIIGPWNYPFQLLIIPLAGALAAGNTAVLKPSEMTPAVSSVVKRMLSSIFSEEYVCVVEGGIQETQTLLTEAWDYIFFTGSTAVGKVIMRAAAEHLTPVTLELGGKNPCIVADDAPLATTARRIAWGKFFNAGQTCIAPDYILVSKQNKEALVQALIQQIKSFYSENPQQSSDYGRIINTRHWDRLKSYLNDGTVLFGGNGNREQRYFEPTILQMTNDSCLAMQDEIFGPILLIKEFENIDDAIKQIQNKPKALALYLFTNNKKIEETVLANTSSGGACVNDTMIHFNNLDLPFGGVGASGMGSYHGKRSFDAFSHKRGIMRQGNWLDIPLRYPPYSDGKLSVIKKLIPWPF